MNQRPGKHLKPITHHLETIQTTLLLLSSYFIYTLLLFPLTSSLNTFVFIFILTMSNLYLAGIVWHDSFLYISFVFWFTFDRTRHQLDLIGSALLCLWTSCVRDNNNRKVLRNAENWADNGQVMNKSHSGGGYNSELPVIWHVYDSEHYESSELSKL